MKFLFFLIAAMIVFGSSTQAQEVVPASPTEFSEAPMNMTEVQKQFLWGFRRNDNCLSRFKPYYFCAASSPKGPYTYAIVGDSHSNSLYPGLVKKLTGHAEQGVLNLGIAFCPPLLDFTRTLDKKLCNNIDAPGTMNEILPIIADDPNIRTVFLAARTVLYVNGFDFNDNNAATPAGLSYYKNRLIKTIGYLNAHKKNVVFVKQVPVLDGDEPKSCISRPGFPGKTPCGIVRSTIDKQRVAFDDMLREISKHHRRLTIIDPLPILCDTTTCYARAGGKLLYRDLDHLSEDGSYFFWSHVQNL